jgi:hypothetical protein
MRSRCCHSSPFLIACISRPPAPLDSNDWKSMMTQFNSLFTGWLKGQGQLQSAREQPYTRLSNRGRGGGARRWLRVPLVNFWLLIRIVCYQLRKYHITQAKFQYQNIDIYIYIYIHTCIYTHIHTRIHTHTHTYTKFDPSCSTPPAKARPKRVNK